VILIGEEDWIGMIDWLRERALANRRIDADDLAGLQVISDPVEVARAVTAARADAAQAGDPRRSTRRER
jgi:predicted Rossmann-fold nucleotide-binding protein